MQFFADGIEGGLSLFLRGKLPNIQTLPISDNVRAPHTVILAMMNALDAGLAAFVSLFVEHILRVRHFAKVLRPIIPNVAIDVIEEQFWVLSVRHFPDHAVSQAQLASDIHGSISARITGVSEASSLARRARKLVDEASVL